MNINDNKYYIDYRVIVFVYFVVLQILLETCLSFLFSFSFYFSKILFVCLYSLILTTLTCIVKRKKMIVLFVSFLTLLIILIYYGVSVYFDNFKSFAVWLQFSKVDELVGLKANLKDFLQKKFNIYFFIIIFLGLFIRFFLNEKVVVDNEKILDTSLVIVFFVSIIVLVLGNSIYINVYGDINKLTVKKSAEYEKSYGVLDMLLMGTLNQKYNFLDSIEENSEDIDMIINYENEKNEMTDIFKGKNIIFIQGESIAPYAIDENLTPTLYKLQKEGINFENYYSTKTNTLESEYAIINSFYLTPEKENESFENIVAMPYLFSKENYETAAFHNYASYYYKRNSRMLELGFDNFYGADELDIFLKENDFPSDVDLFEKSQQFVDYKGTKSFFHYYITVTAHGGYIKNDRLSLVENLEFVEKYYPNYPDDLKTYYASSMKTDQGVEYLLNNLSENGVLKDTIIVFVGDHYPYGLSDKSIDIVSDFEQPLDVYKVPFFIWGTEVKSEENDIIMSNIEILPTLSNMFGLDLDYSLGTDVYSSNAKEKIIVEWYDNHGYSILTNYGGYDALSDTIIGGMSDQKLRYYSNKSDKRELANKSEYLKTKIKRRKINQNRNQLVE